MMWYFAIIATGMMVGACASSQESAARKLHALVAREFAPYKSGGVVLVARNGRPIFRRSYGLADVELNVAMRPEHIFRIGSVTKQFTAFAVLQLVSEGRLRLDDDVRAYVPEFATHGSRVTIEHLLTHTGGVPTLIDLPNFETFARQDHTVAALLSLTRDVPLHFEPGTSFRYSDTGYILLGAVIERISGMAYASYVETRLAAPLRLHSTRYGAESLVIPMRARGYTMSAGQLRNAPYISMTVPHGAGALVSTVDDLLLWQLAMRSGRIVPAALTAKALHERTLPDGSKSGYGFGVKACTVGGHRTIGHGGFINGFSSTAIQLPDDEIDVIVLVNNDGDAPDAGRLARRIARVMLGGAPTPDYVTLTTRERLALAGSYEFAPNDVRHILDSAGALFSRRNRGGALPLRALSALELTLEDSEGAYVMRFETGSDGRVSRMRSFLSCEPVNVAQRIPVRP